MGPHGLLDFRHAVPIVLVRLSRRVRRRQDVLVPLETFLQHFVRAVVIIALVNQICIAGLLQGLAEALDFGRRSGLDLNLVLDTIGKGAAGSWQMENRGSTMVKNEFDFGFAVDLMRKDLGIALDEAKRNGSTLALTALVDQYYADVQKLGGSRWDTSSLLTRLK